MTDTIKPVLTDDEIINEHDKAVYRATESGKAKPLDVAIEFARAIERAAVAQERAEVERLRGIVPEVLERLNDELCADNDRLRDALRCAEAALSDIGDAEREPGDDLAWCEARAAKDLPTVRAAICELVDANALRRWSAKVQAAERERCALVCETAGIDFVCDAIYAAAIRKEQA